MKSEFDGFIEVIKSMSEEKIKKLLETHKEDFSQDGYNFFENLIQTIRTQSKQVIS